MKQLSLFKRKSQAQINAEGIARSRAVLAKKRVETSDRLIAFTNQEIYLAIAMVSLLDPYDYEHHEKAKALIYKCRAVRENR